MYTLMTYKPLYNTWHEAMMETYFNNDKRVACDARSHTELDTWGLVAFPDEWFDIPEDDND